ncbi:MAG: haloalkane dehalogenase, partial [Glaciecola sp.]
GWTHTIVTWRAGVVGSGSTAGNQLELHMTKSFVDVLGTQMAYVEAGVPDGPAVVFLHGNPTSSFLWREVWPAVADTCRVIAPDLIGMGDSAKLNDAGPGSYRFVDHARYLDALLELVVPDGPVVLVIHDWGSALGFHWANRHRDRVAGIAYMEAVVRPVEWDEWPQEARGIFEALRSEAGESLVLDKNLFVENILPASVMGTMSEEVMAEYRRPFANPGEDRRPTLTWPREIPLGGEPKDVVELVGAYADWLASDTEVPKLFVNAEPGMILTGPQRDFVRTWRNQREVTVPGLHFIQEDSGPQIGAAVRAWLDEVVLA